MQVYIGLLRGINVSGKHLVKMDVLKRYLREEGFADVQTYIQSGNLVFKAAPESKSSLGTHLENRLSARCGFKIPVLLYTPEEWRTVLDLNPFITSENADTTSLYYIFWKAAPAVDLSAKLSAANIKTEEWAIGEYCIYLKCNRGYGRAKLNNNFLERLGGVEATTRNHRTVLKLADLASRREP